MSVQKGVFPSKLKEAKVIPVYKSDVETEPGNYRPISLLSVFNRIFEKLMYHRLKSFLDKNDVLFKAQYGFREKYSTQHAILDTVTIIQNNMDLKLFTCGIFIALKKAFDTVDHAILLQKPDHYFFFFCILIIFIDYQFYIQFTTLTYYLLHSLTHTYIQAHTHPNDKSTKILKL